MVTGKKGTGKHGKDYIPPAKWNVMLKEEQKAAMEKRDSKKGGGGKKRKGKGLSPDGKKKIEGISEIARELAQLQPAGSAVDAAGNPVVPHAVTGVPATGANPADQFGRQVHAITNRLTQAAQAMESEFGTTGTSS